MSLAAAFNFFRIDFDRSAKSLATERKALIAERERRVLNHQAVADVDAELRRLTHTLLRRRRRARA